MATGRAQISKMVELGGAVANNTNKKKKPQINGVSPLDLNKQHISVEGIIRSILP